MGCVCIGVYAYTDKNWYFNKIQYGINFVRNEIQPYFKNRNVGQQTPKPVSKTKLTELWKTNKRRAIEIVTQDGMDCPQSYCPLSKGDVTQFYTNKSHRIIGEWNPDLAPWVDLDIFPPPVLNSTSLTQWITKEEVKDVLRTTPNSSAPGYDQLTNVDYKLSNVVPILTSIFNTCLSNCKIPSDWKHAIIKLIPKSSIDAIDLSEWRPISKLVTIYKMFMMIIGERVMPRVVDTNRLSCKQKGSLPRNGLQEHLLCLNSSIADFKHRLGKMYIMFLDLANLNQIHLNIPANVAAFCCNDCS